MSDLLWRTREGEMVAPRDMKDRHLLHAHRMVVRHEKVRLYATLRFLATIPSDLPDGADMAVNAEIEEMSEISPFLCAFQAEIKKRGLTPLETL